MEDLAAVIGNSKARLVYDHFHNEPEVEKEKE
jgi:hypothetical protein